MYNTTPKTHCPQGHEYTEENTAIRPRKTGKPARQCRVCHRAQAKKALKKSRPSRKHWYYSILMTHSCVDCGESHPVTLQFDHVNPSEKLFTIADGVHNGYSKKRILEEMAKCQVRCANCHAKRTAIQFGWYRHLPDEFRSTI